MNKPLPADDLRRVVEQVGDAWEQLRDKHVVITGCDGFVGRWMLESLLAKFYHGRDVFVDRVGSRSRCESEYWHVDGPVDGWWPRYSPDCIIHATTDGVGWQHVAAVARAAGARMLLLSSGAVYGQWKGPMTEDGITPNGYQREHLNTASWETTQYGYDKKQQERQCEDVAVIARLFTFIGPGLRRHTGREFLEVDPITVNDDGAVRSYLYASDMAAWLWRCLLLGQVGRAYNVGSGEAMRVVDFTKRCSDIRKVERVRKGVQAIDGTYYVPDVSRAEQELGCRQTVSLDDAIRRTLAWQQS